MGDSAVNFDLIWDDQSIDLKEMPSDEFLNQFGIDPTDFDTELEAEGWNSTNETKEASSVEITASSSCQFLDISEKDVHSFIEEQSNKATLKKTLCDVRKFENFLKSKNEDCQMCSLGPEKLDEYLANFILSIRKCDGQDYEPSTLRNIVSSIERKLKRQKYPHQIMNNSSNHFQLTRDALKAKQKSLKKQGKGNKSLRASPLTTEEIDILYERGILGGHNAKSLLNVLWMNNCLMFGLRGTKEIENNRWGDVKLKRGPDGVEYIEYFAERQTKTRTVESVDDIRQMNPKIFANQEDAERCPVNFYKLYTEKRPIGFFNPNDPFYLAPRTASQKQNDTTWYMKMTIGEKKLGSFMKCMAAEAGFETERRLTNHSTRKHLVQKLRDCGIAPTDIMQISGHKNIQSVLNYSAISENKQKECSKILSNSRQPAAAIISYNDVQESNSVSNPILVPQIPLLKENETIQSSELSIIKNQGSLMKSNPENTSSNSFSLQNDNVNVNNNLNSLFSGAILNIQNLNVYMK